MAAGMDDDTFRKSRTTTTGYERIVGLARGLQSIFASAASKSSGVRSD
jgi:hypothetical protein